MCLHQPYSLKRLEADRRAKEYSGNFTIVEDILEPKAILLRYLKGLVNNSDLQLLLSLLTAVKMCIATHSFCFRMV